MTAQDFCYWLRGVLEIAEPTQLNARQIEIINKHLDLVLTPVFKVTAQVTAAPKMFQPTDSDRERLRHLAGLAGAGSAKDLIC